MAEHYARLPLHHRQAVSGDGRAVMVRMTSPKLVDVWLLASTEHKRLDQFVVYRPGMRLGRRRRG